MRKVKGSGFKMRSGNKTEFKKMGSSPAKTDATLGAAAQDLGRSNIPKDNKAMVELQYRGINAYNKAKANMTADIMEGVKKGAEAYMEGEGAIANLGKLAQRGKEKKRIEGLSGDERKEAQEAFDAKYPKGKGGQRFFGTKEEDNTAENRIKYLEKLLLRQNDDDDK